MLLVQTEYHVQGQSVVYMRHHIATEALYICGYLLSINLASVCL